MDKRTKIISGQKGGFGNINSARGSTTITSLLNRGLQQNGNVSGVCNVH